MALPPSSGGFIQDLPPPGGYPEIRFSRALRKRGPPGWALWLGGVGVVTYGFSTVIRGNRRRNAMKRENREARYCIFPYLRAEWDRNYVSEKKSRDVEEERIMGHLDGWKVGGSVLKAKNPVWVAPRPPFPRQHPGASYNIPISE